MNAKGLQIRAMIFLALLVGGWLGGAEVKAVDRVTLRGGNGRYTLLGTVEDYTGEFLSLTPPGATVPRRIPAGDVISIDTQQVSAFKQGESRWKNNEIGEAYKEFERALLQEQRGWVRRDILAWMVRCAVRRGDTVAAASRYLLMMESDPQSRHFPLIPLAWAPQQLTDAVRDEARLWIGRTTPLDQLLGASHLLDDPRLRESATARLTELSRHKDNRIRQYATAQLWRDELARTGDPGELVLEQRRHVVEFMPAALRGGPYYILGRAYTQRSDHAMAAACYLWLVVQDDTNYALSARACSEAAHAMQALGREVDAQTLHLEVQRRFPDTAFAAEAQESLRAK